MLRGIRSGRLSQGIPPEVFVPEKGWYETIVNSGEAIAEATRKLPAVTDRDDYLFPSQWDALEAHHGADAVARIEELYREMEDGILAGGSPYGPAELLYSDDWALFAAELDPADLEAMKVLENKMVNSVLHENGQPYAPQQVFKVDVWLARIETANDEKDFLHYLFNQCRTRVLNSHGEEEMLHPARAEFNFAWQRIQRDVGPSDTVTKLIADASKDATDYYDENELITPPGPRAADMQVEHYLETVRTYVSNERRQQADAAWMRKIEETTDVSEKADWMNKWHAMRAAYFNGHDLYRPHNIPAPKPNYAAAAKALGFEQGLLPDRQGEWQYRRVLGKGAMGVATLWVRLDSSGRVIDHEVLKDTYLRYTSGVDLWNNPVFWHGPIENRVAAEWTMVRDLKRLADSQNIIEYHAGQAYPPLRMYRIYMEYGDHGTLDDLIDSYIHFGDSAVTDTDGNTLPYNVPHRLAWSIFEQLTIALFLAHKGRSPDQHLHPAHDPIIHRDIKPANIFLAKRAPQARIWPELPIVKLADWGLATRTSNAHFVSWPCRTPGWSAPEQRAYSDEQKITHDIRPVDEKADIFAVGRVMLALLSLEDNPDDYTFEDEDIDWELTHPNKDVYGAEGGNLFFLIQWCLRKRPENRPGVERLLKCIAMEVKASGQGLLGRLPMKLRDREDGEVLLWEDSRYLKWGR